MLEIIHKRQFKKLRNQLISSKIECCKKGNINFFKFYYKLYHNISAIKIVN
jgi:hypothetical protein